MPGRKVKDRYMLRRTEEIVKEYEKGRSALEIAVEFGTYVQKVYRILDKAGVKRRSQSEAQKLALDEGRSVHPTKGKKSTEEVKLKISDSVSRSWKEMSEEGLEARKAKTRAQYEAMSEDEKEHLRSLATQAILTASREGSKLEKFLLAELTKNGYKVVFHKKGFILNDKLEIDLLLPTMKVAVEVDGVYHQVDVHSNGALTKVQAKDNEKNGLLLAHGYVVIRLANLAKTCSPPFMRERRDTLLAKLKEIKESFPKEGERLIYL